MIRYQRGIAAIDSGYERPNLAAIHYIVDSDEVGIVDTGTNASVPKILDGLSELGRSPAEVRYVLLTHIHLDHAGGAGLLMEHCPNAQLVVHPRGVRHMVDPTKLWEGTVEVYGAVQADALYGRIRPIDPARIIEAKDETTLDLGARTLRFLDTPGHARHHVVIADSATGHVFAGDIFGISYREYDNNGQAFVVPTSSPTQFEPEAAHKSLGRITGLAPEAVYLTHYSQVRGIPRLAQMMHRLIDAYVAVAQAEREPRPERHAALKRGLERVILEEADRHGLRSSHAQLRELLALDIELNAQGLAIWLDTPPSVTHALATPALATPAQ